MSTRPTTSTSLASGEIHKISYPYLGYIGYSKQARDLRSFPNGTRNCYTLPVKPGRKHLVRAWFLYGNYDGLEKPPSFQVQAGVSHWFISTFANTSINYYYELVFLAEANQRSIDVCLVNTDGGTPFISALELRQMPNEMYPQVNVSQALSLVGRKGITSQIRYPKDEYDRIWQKVINSAWEIVTTSSPVKTVVTSYQPPSDVLQTAAYPKRGSTLDISLTMKVDPGRADPPKHIFLYFAELQKLKTN